MQLKGTEMGRIDLDSFSLTDLKQLQKDIAKAIDGYEDRQRQEARATLEAQAREMGFSLSELVDPGKRKASKKINPPKYRHPENPEMTWSGRGRRPDWVNAILSGGGSLDEHLI
jgi:DNA-binding protein H-NS